MASSKFITIEAADVSTLKTQSPLTLRWRLGVEVRHTCRFGTIISLGSPSGPMDSRRYRDSSLLLLGDAFRQLPDTRSIGVRVLRYVGIGPA
jgi:hypothetical protein